MSYGLANLLTANRSSSVLQGIMNPPQINPLGAMTSAAQTAGAIYDIRAKQAQQAWGQALQQATDANGNVDYPKAQAIAAKDSLATMGMATNLANASNLRGQQINQVSGLYNLAGNAAASLMNDPSDGNIERIRGSLTAAGAPASFTAELDRIKAISDPNQRRAEAYNHVVATINGQDQLARGGYGAPVPTDVGGQVQGITYRPPSPYGPGGMGSVGGVNIGLSPGQTLSGGITYKATQADVQAGRASAVGQDVFVPGPEVLRRAGIPLPPGLTSGPGVVDSTGKPVSPTNQPRLNVPGPTTPPSPPTATTPAPAPPATPATPPAAPVSAGNAIAATAPAPLPVPPVPPAAVPPPTTTPAPVQPPADTSGNAAAAASATAKATGRPVPVPGGNGLVAKPDGTVGPPVAPAPPPGTSQKAMVPLSYNATAGGVPVASVNALAPNLGAPSAPSPAVAGDVNALMQGIAQARAPGQPPGVQTAGFNTVVTGPGVNEATQNKASGDLLTQHDLAAAQYPQTVFPYVQALHQYGQGVTTAPGSDILNTGKGWINGVARSMGLSEPTNSTEAYDTLHKYLQQIVSGNPVAAGSDARMAAVLGGSANTSINELAGADVIKAGVAIQRMTAALDSSWHAMSPAQQAQYGGNYLEYLRTMAPKVDVRAFARDMYNSAQLKTLNDSLQSGSEEDAQRFMDTLRMGMSSGYITKGGVRAMP